MIVSITIDQRKDAFYLHFKSAKNIIRYQKKWNGVLLKCWDIVEACALRMKWKGEHPTVMRIEGDYPTGVIVPKEEMKQINKRLERSETLRKYDVIIKPKRPRGR